MISGLVGFLAPVAAALLLPTAAPSRHAPVAMAASLPSSEKVAFMVLAGGSGSRMKADRPKQFLELQGKPVLQWSLELLLASESCATLVLVIAEEFRSLDFLQPALADPRVVCALPGKERQDSVRSGLASVPEECTLVAVHDAARPLVTLENINECLCDAATHGAAVLAVPMKATVKESEDGEFVQRTLQRSKLWEIQTPQVIRPQLLRDGFEKVEAENLEVTDDVSIVELLGEPVKLTMGEYTNFKLTTPEDMGLAESILEERAA